MCPKVNFLHGQVQVKTWGRDHFNVCKFQFTTSETGKAGARIQKKSPSQIYLFETKLVLGLKVCRSRESKTHIIWQSTPLMKTTKIGLERFTFCLHFDPIMKLLWSPDAWRVSKDLPHYFQVFAPKVSGFHVSSPMNIVFTLEINCHLTWI